MTPPSKRPKHSSSCRLCLSCKTRCDEVTSLGCGRCREKKRLCSLIDPNSDHQQVDNSQGDARMVDVSASIKALEQRVETLTDLVASQTSWSTAATVADGPSTMTPSQSLMVPTLSVSPAVLPHASTAIFPSTIPVLPGPAPLPNVHRILHSTAWDEARNSTYDISDFPDVRLTHGITADQLEHAYML